MVVIYYSAMAIKAKILIIVNKTFRRTRNTDHGLSMEVRAVILIKLMMKMESVDVQRE